MKTSVLKKSTLGLAALAALAAGCRSADSESPDSVEGQTSTTQERLYGLGTIGARWPTAPDGRTLIPVCFADFTAGDVRYEKIKCILNDTWHAVSNVTFTGWGACPPAASRIRVTFVPPDDKGSFGGACLGYGLPATGDARDVQLMDEDDANPDPGLGTNISRFRYEVIHEFGHALGFAHEQQRPDNWVYVDEGENKEPLDCPAPQRPTEDLSDPAYARWLQAMQQWYPVSGGIYLTSYDGSSIMGYCSSEPGATGMFFNFAQNLSASDVAGARAPQAYGANPTRLAVKRGILWRHASGEVREWTLTGRSYSTTTLPAQAAISTAEDLDWQIKGSGDFNGDGVGDILWEHSDGSLAIWNTNSGSVSARQYPGRLTVHTIRGIGDFNNDGKSDILFQHTSGQITIWWGGSPAGAWSPGGAVPSDWVIQAVGDFNGDRHADILWRATSSGRLAVWWQGDPSRVAYTASVGSDWSIKGVGDFDANGTDDLLWRSNTGQVTIWPTIYNSSGSWFPGGADPSGAWSIAGVGDFDSDNRADILWRSSAGQTRIWWSGSSVGQTPIGGSDPSWSVQATMKDLRN